MARLRDVDRMCVVQRNSSSGCIPASVEWLLRYGGASEIDWDWFQDGFDLVSTGQGQNSLSSVTKAVMAKYGAVRLQVEPGCGDPETNLGTIEGLIETGHPCAISIALGPNGPWHVVPVVEVSDEIVEVQWLNHCSAASQTVRFSRAEIVRRQREWAAGDDFVFLVEPTRAPDTMQPEVVRDRGGSSVDRTISRMDVLNVATRSGELVLTQGDSADADTIVVPLDRLPQLIEMLREAEAELRRGDQAQG